jgi:hypothetical protein
MPDLCGGGPGLRRRALRVPALRGLALLLERGVPQDVRQALPAGAT